MYQKLYNNKNKNNKTIERITLKSIKKILLKNSILYEIFKTFFTLLEKTTNILTPFLNIYSFLVGYICIFDFKTSLFN